MPPLHSRFKPGQSGNPGGRPKGADLRAAIRRKLAKDPDEDGFGRLTVELADLIVDFAKSADRDAVATVSMLIDQVQGKPQERVEHSGGQTLVQIVGVEVPDEAPDEAQEPQ